MVEDRLPTLDIEPDQAFGSTIGCMLAHHLASLLSVPPVCRGKALRMFHVEQSPAPPNNGPPNLMAHYSNL